MCPGQTTILDWIWKSGTRTRLPRKIDPLASVDPPKRATAMRSFIGAYKALSRCIPKYASLLSLEESICGLQGAQEIMWTPDLTEHFKNAQSALRSPRNLSIPIPSDMLILTFDAHHTAGVLEPLYLS